MENRLEGKIYKLDNPYLTQDEKVAVESWFQLPGNVMEYAFWGTAIFSVYYPMSFIYVIGVPMVLNLLSGLINWYLYNKKLSITLGLSLFHPFVTSIVGVGVAIFLFSNNEILLAVISAFVGMFSFLLLELHMFLYSFLAQKYKMHMKYVFAKKHLGSKLPFDKKDS